jgi:hypothetical protein
LYQDLLSKEQKNRKIRKWLVLLCNQFDFFKKHRFVRVINIEGTNGTGYAHNVTIELI